MTREIKKLSCPALLAAFFAFGASCSSSPETGITKGIGGTSTATGGGSTAIGGPTSGAGGTTTATGGSVTGGSTTSAGGTTAATGGNSKGAGGTTFATSGSATSTGGNTAGTAGAGGTGGIRDAGVAGGTTSAGGTVSTGGAASTGGTSSTSGSRDAAVTDGATSTGGSRDAAITDGATSTGGSRDAAIADGATSTGGAGGASGAGGSQMQPFKGIAGGACKVRTAMKVSWYYNWSPSENEACAVANGVEYVPMIWGADTAANIKTAVAGLASKGFKYVLGFNEPDNTTQSNITVASAIALLPAFNSPTIAVGTPSTQANTTGQAWFTQYMADVAANTALRADFIAIHWYGWNAGSCDAAASQLESYIKYAEGFPGNRPIWLTEWGCLNQSAPTAAGVIAFFQAALAVFAKHPRLARYAWYQWSPNCEVYNTDDTLTELGQVYAAAPSMK
jgi:Glycosyl hydrolase catalytic core